MQKRILLHKERHAEFYAAFVTALPSLAQVGNQRKRIPESRQPTEIRGDVGWDWRREDPHYASVEILVMDKDLNVSRKRCSYR